MSLCRRELTEVAGPFSGARDHLQAELDRLALMVEGELARLRATGLSVEDEFRGLHVSEQQIRIFLHPAVAMVSDEWRHRLRTAQENLAGRAAATSGELPLARAVRVFSLSPLERDALLIAAAPELDLRFEQFYSYLHNDVTRKRATPDLVLRLLCPSIVERWQARSIFSAHGTLFRFGLLRFVADAQAPDAVLLARPLSADRRVIDFLLGQLDPRLPPGDAPATLDAMHIAPVLRAALRSSPERIIYLQGPGGCGKRSIAWGLSRESGRTLLTFDLSRTSAPLSGLMAGATREAILTDSNVLYRHAEVLIEDEPRRREFESAIADPSGPVVTYVATESPWPARVHPVFEIPVPSFDDRARLWRAALPRCAPDDAAALAAKFALTGGQIHDACRVARSHAAGDLEAAARAQSSHSLHRLAQKIEAVHNWNDLVLPPRAMHQLREVCASQKFRHVVLSEWGFDRHLSGGRGLNVLFSGPSGTGKTMSAGVIASELGLDLYKIDLSSVVSKFIGETEKQLNRIFREASCSNAVLFFDEADALFGKRSEVRDAHDRYANIETAYLLQKMEEYDGVVILATNLRKNIDEAFTRRMQYIVEFPFPDAALRERIWKQLVPPRAPLAADVNFSFLGRQFELSGGNIRNVVFSAALLAAEAGSSIGMDQFIVATSRELQKLGRLPSRAEFREYYELIRTQI